MALSVDLLASIAIELQSGVSRGDRFQRLVTALRRVLTLLIDWAEADRQSPDLSLIRESA